MWRRVQADGCEWEVRALANEASPTDPADDPGDEILEFRPTEGLRQPRRVAVPNGSLTTVSDDQLLVLFRRARPIGGDHYGRPGKPMKDIAV